MSKGDKPQTPARSASGLELQPFYSAKDNSKTLEAELSPPGSFPYTRGIHSSMYRGKLWTMRQYAGYGTARETNKRYRYLLEQGTTGLSVAFDLPTQMGRDADHELSHGEVGRVGVSISCLADMEDLLAEIPLADVSISMTINSTAAILLGFLLCVAEKQKIGWEKLRGTVQNDVLKEYIARGTYVYPPEHALRIATDLFAFCEHEVPQWNTISISGYHIREAGSTAVQELALTFANGIAYVEAALKAGLKIDQFAPRLAFFFNCHSDFFEEIAKFRAARRLWAKIMRTRFKAKDERSCMLRFHTQTAGSSLTAQQPLNNVARTTLQALAGVLGGTQSLHTNSYDEALGLPTEESAQLALRTQQIIAHESNVAAVADPLGGSYYIEDLTRRLEEAAERQIAEIDSLGGMLAAIERGYPQGEIERSAYEFQRQVESKERLIVGVNSFQVKNEKLPTLQKLSSQGEKDQCRRLAKIRRSRDKKLWERSLKALSQSAREGTNLVPKIIDAIRADATLGEIADCLREEFGQYRPACA